MSEKGGRPKLGKETCKRINVCLPSTTFVIVRQAAEEQGQSYSAFIRDLILGGLSDTQSRSTRS